LTGASFGSDLDEATKNVINTAVASPAMQQYQFTIAPGCRYSVINAMYFCNSVEAKGSYTENGAYDGCGQLMQGWMRCMLLLVGRGEVQKKVVPAVAIG